MIRIVCLAATAACALLLAAQGRAALVAIGGTGTVTSSPLADIVVGDQFSFVVTYDDSITDASASGGQGLFPGAVTAFSLNALGGNTGTWIPGTGTAGSTQIITTEFIDLLLMQILDVTGYNQANGLDLIDISGPSLRLQNNNVNDTGAGQTLAAQIGGLPDLSTLHPSDSLTLEFGTPGNTQNVVMSLSNLSIVPEPSSWALATFAAAGLFLLGRARRRLIAIN